MKGSKYLAKNVGLLTISQFGTKLLSFFLVPLYTNILSTVEYGTYDLYNSTISLMVPILTLNICDSTLRFSLDKKNDKKDIFGISIFHYLIGAFIVVVAIAGNYIFNVFPIINDYPFLFALMFMGISLNGIMTYFARGIEKIKEVAISGVICSGIMLTLNIIFLLPMRMRLLGYFLANIFGIFSQSLYLYVSIRGWKYIRIGKQNKKLHNDMLAFSKPMIVNNISWWVNNASDRYVVTWICGVAANGIYSVSYKIPSILAIFQSIFNQAWTISAVHDFDPEDKNGFFANMYDSYNVCITILCAVLIAGSRIIAKLLYAKDFYKAWKYAPFLLISVVFGALSGYIGGIFAAVKDSKIFAQSTLVAAIVNIVLNIILVWKIGVVGAAIATAIAYLITWMMRIIYVKKYINLHLNLYRDCVSYIILLVQTIILYLIDEGIILYSIESILILAIICLYRTQIKSILSTGNKILRGGR